MSVDRNTVKQIAKLARIRVPDDQLDHLAGELSNILEAQNSVTPGGSIRLGPERIVIEPSGNFESIEEMRRAIVQLPDSEEVLYLEDLVEITRDYVDPPVNRVHTGAGALLFHAEEPSFPLRHCEERRAELGAAEPVPCAARNDAKGGASTRCQATRAPASLERGSPRQRTGASAQDERRADNHQPEHIIRSALRCSQRSPGSRASRTSSRWRCAR